MKTRAVGDQQGGDLAIEIEWKTAPAAEAKKVIGKKQSYTIEDWKKCFIGIGTVRNPYGFQNRKFFFPFFTVSKP